MTERIDLVLTKNGVFLWNAEDWSRLREEQRIIGESIGCLSKLPRQDVLSGLPLLLLPEEVTLLLEKQVGRLVRYSMNDPPSESLKKSFDKSRENSYAEQELCLRETRRKQIVATMDKIVEGKRRKILGLETAKKKTKKPLDKKVQDALSDIEINTERLLKEELDKLPKLERTEALIQTHTAYPWGGKTEVESSEWKYPVSREEFLRYLTFKDLWERGYYVTTGEKFGGDFLVYPGDPVAFHAQFIVQCINEQDEMSIAELLSQCRVACNVRKTLVLAAFSKDEKRVKYQSFQWTEGNEVLQSA